MTSVEERSTRLRELFARALDIWREVGSGGEYDAIWPVLDEAAAFGKEAMDVALQLLKSDDSGRRAVASDLLGCVAAGFAPSRTVIAEALVEALSNELDIDAAWSQITALGATESTEVVPMLVQFTDSPTPALRVQAVLSLSEIEMSGRGNADVLTALAKSTEDDDLEVRQLATTIVAVDVDTARGGEELVVALRKRLFDSDDETRLMAIYGLARRRDAQAISAVQSALERPSVPDIIFAAAKELAAEELVPYLERADHSDDDDLYAEALDVCRAGSDDE